MRRSLLVGLAVGLLLTGLAAGIGLYWASPTVLRVAVGPAGSDDAKLIAAIAQYLGREHESIRLKIVPADSEADSSAKLEAGEADLAVVRTDIALPARAETVAILHRDVVVLFSLPDRGIGKLGDLRGRRVGVVRRAGANRRLLELVLTHIDVPPASVTIVPIEEPAEVGPALRDDRIDAAMVVGSVSGRTVIDTVTAVTAAGEGANPVVIAVPDAEAVAQRSPIYESSDVVRGAFGGATPRPPETLKTLGVTHRLVAATAVNDNIVAELTRLIFAMRPSVAVEVPLANRIVAPDYEKGASLPVHAGATAYYEGEVQGFIERNTDMIYLGAMALSVVGSGFAAVASRAGSRKRARTLDTLERLLFIVAAAREAHAPAALDELEREADAILGRALESAGQGLLDSTGVSAFALGMDQARGAISDRRAALALLPRALPHAAE